MNSQSRRDLVWLILAGIFITNAILGELTGGKLFSVGPFSFGDSSFGPVTMSIGVLPWTVVFLTTDLINEYFGKAGVRKLTFFTVILIIYAFVVVFAAMQVPAVDFSPVKDEQFNAVFGQSLWIIIGSVI